MEQLISTIAQIKINNQFKKYIDFIQFPYYRNLEINSKINFEFPLTVFVGQNGCGKSSCLHALFGAPEGYTPYKFWFDTKVDPIEYYDDLRRRHSFWYSFHDNSGTPKEVVKARIKRGEDPNYWETSRPLVWAGMKKRSDDKRDKPIEKNVVYLDFRGELSAFDKFFYFGSIKKSKSKNKQEFIRNKSASLKKLFLREKTTINSSKRVLNDPVKELDELEIKWVSYILNRKYLGGLSVKHELFRNEGYSVLFKTNYAIYSEAFAGSGEMAVVRLVKEVLSAQDYSLILLDEPEVSLHPGAQKRLVKFLLEQIKLKKHQIVITSHSPSIISELPNTSIKAFFQLPSNGRFFIKENLSPHEAFYHLEFSLDDKKTLIVEDVLAKEIVNCVLEKLGEEKKHLVNIKYNPGGVSVLKKEIIPVYCREDNSKNFVLFDGDQKKIPSHYDWRTFVTNDINTGYLQEKIREQTDSIITFSTDGGDGGRNDQQQIDLLKKYLDYFLSHVFYLPKSKPEEMIWDDNYAEQLLLLSVERAQTVKQHLTHIVQTNCFKLKFAYLANILTGDNTAANIQYVQKMFIQKWLNLKNNDFILICSVLDKTLEM